MRLTQWKFLGVALLLGLVGVQCAPAIKTPTLRKPPQVEVEGAGELKVSVTDMRKRPLRPEELSPSVGTGYLWEYRVKISNPTGPGIALDRLRLTVQNLWGRSWPGDQPLNLTIEPKGMSEVMVQARLSTSDPEDQAGLTGIEVLTFLGRTDNGSPLSFTLRVPLD
jgi:hypothetical protein